MKTEEMYALLKDLNTLEIDFQEKHHLIGRKVLDYATYKQYLSTPFIVQNNLAGIYWPQIEGKVPVKVPSMLSELPLLDEDVLLFSGLNFQISKKINFQSDLKRFNNYFECLYVLDGSLQIQCCGKSFSLTDGDFFFLPPYLEYTLDSSLDCLAIHIVIRRNHIIGKYSKLFARNPLIVKFFDQAVAIPSRNDYMLIHTGHQEDIRDLILHTMIEYLYTSKGKEDAIYAYLSLIFNKLMNYCEGAIETSIAISKFELYYKQVLDYLDSEYRTATLESTAREIFFSKQYLCRIIREVSGKNFSQLLTEIRIKKAKQFILETDIALEAIAEYTGFADCAHLSRTFKKEVGVPPSVYRRNKGKI